VLVVTNKSSKKPIFLAVFWQYYRGEFGPK